MDLGLLSAATQATTFPPQDVWLLGHTVNYYYFGYLMVGTLAEVTGIATSVAYNLGMALVPALAAVGLLGLAVTLVMRRGASRETALLCGLGGVVLLGLMSNLEGVLEFARVRGLGSPAFWEGLDIKGLETAVAQTSWYPEQGWWWWRATRVIDTVESGVSLDYTIQEFPLFSFMLGDLHPHMMSIPFLLLTLGLGLQLLATPGHPSRAWYRDQWGLLLVTGLSLGALGAINAWDLPTFMALAMALIAVKAYRDWRSREDGRRQVARGPWLCSLWSLRCWPTSPTTAVWRGRSTAFSRWRGQRRSPTTSSSCGGCSSWRWPPSLSSRSRAGYEIPLLCSSSRPRGWRLHPSSPGLAPWRSWTARLR